MAMTMTGEVQLAASRDVVWVKLNDPEVLKICIPGCEELNKTSDTEFQAVATTKIGSRGGCLPAELRWPGSSARRGNGRPLRRGAARWRAR